jgi:hypothetical protein
MIDLHHAARVSMVDDGLCMCQLASQARIAESLALCCATPWDELSESDACHDARHQSHDAATADRSTTSHSL